MKHLVRALSRNIRTNVIHFTPYENLKGIAKHGIIPRSRFPKELHRVCPDDSRLDNLCQYNCFTLSFPNYRMLYKYHKEKPFVVLAIDIAVLKQECLSDVLFFHSNASKGDYRFFGPSEFRGLAAVQSMFVPEGRYCDLPSNYTTDPQAEVMIEQIIPPKYITDVYFDPRDRQRGASCDKTNVFKAIAKESADYFFPRQDWEIWQKE